jgi:hypothetical protein
MKVSGSMWIDRVFVPRQAAEMLRDKSEKGLPFTSLFKLPLRCLKKLLWKDQSERCSYCGGFDFKSELTFIAVFSGIPVRVINWFTMSFWLEVIGGILTRPPAAAH